MCFGLVAWSLLAATRQGYCSALGGGLWQEDHETIQSFMWGIGGILTAAARAAAVHFPVAQTSEQGYQQPR